MKKSSEGLQLDLTAAVTDVPQANSLPLFIRFIEAVHQGHDEVSELATALGVEVRTVHYYADFGRWLGFVQNAGAGQLALSQTGQTFAESVPARGRLFSAALFAKKLVQTVQSLKREAVESTGYELGTQEACLKAILALTDLAESTAQRRASALGAMLQWAYKPSSVDWTTGEPNEQARAPFDFEGQSFLTALAARQFGSSRTLEIAFPRQVLTFVKASGDGMHGKHWTRASYDHPSRSAIWFGSLPVNASTVAVVRRRGPDLRRLIVTCVPYVSLLVTMLTLKDMARRPLVHLTDDMYGLQLWYRDIALGAPLAVIAEAAHALGLATVNTIPHLEGRYCPEDRSMGSDADLVELLLLTGLARQQDTKLVLCAGFDEALRQGSEAIPPLADRLRVMEPTIEDYLRKKARATH